MVSEEYRGAKQWSRDKQAVFTVIWISFLCAAVATMVFFALFDPVVPDDPALLGLTMRAQWAGIDFGGPGVMMSNACTTIFGNF